MLSESNQRVLRAIAQFIDQHGYSPTFEEIADLVGFASKSVVSHHVTRLQIAGLITYRRYSPRTIRMIGGDQCSKILSR